MTAIYVYLPILLKASLMTFAMAIGALVFATLLGGLGAYLKLSANRYHREYADVYTAIIRGIPDLVLILLFYFGLQDLLNSITEPLGLGVWSISTFWAAVMAIGFIYGAYLTETFRGAYLAVPIGQKEAATALGLSNWQKFIKVVLPQLIRHAIPGYGNVFQVLIKSTAVVGVIGLLDLVGIANDAGKTTREPLVFMLFVMFMYLIFAGISGFCFRILERKYAEVTR